MVQLPPRKMIVCEGGGERGVALRGKPVNNPLMLKGSSDSVGNLIRSSGMEGKSLALKKTAKSPKPHPLKSATPTPELDHYMTEEMTVDQQDLEFFPTDEVYLFQTPPTPLHLDPQNAVTQLPADTGQDVEDVYTLEVGGSGMGDGVCADGVGGDRCSPVKLIVLDDVTNTTNKSPTPVSSCSSADSANSVHQSIENLDGEEISTHPPHTHTHTHTSAQRAVFRYQVRRRWCALGVRRVVRRSGSSPHSLWSRSWMVSSECLCILLIIYVTPHTHSHHNTHRRVSDLTRNKIIQWLRLRRPVILDIFKGKVFSQRHKDYLTSGKKRGE